MLETLLDGSRICQCCLTTNWSHLMTSMIHVHHLLKLVPFSSPPQSHLDCCGFDNDTRYFTQESPNECMEGHPRCNTSDEELLVVRGYLIRK